MEFNAETIRAAYISIGHLLEIIALVFTFPRLSQASPTNACVCGSVWVHACKQFLFILRENVLTLLEMKDQDQTNGLDLLF